MTSLMRNRDKQGQSPIVSHPHPALPRQGGGNLYGTSAPIYLGGVLEEETIVFDGPDISWELEWEEFKAAIREKREPLGSGRDGLEANRMIAAVYRSAKENRPVKLTEINVDRVTEC